MKRTFFFLLLWSLVSAALLSGLLIGVVQVATAAPDLSTPAKAVTADADQFVPGEIIVALQRDRVVASGMFGTLDVSVAETFVLHDAAAMDGDGTLDGMLLSVPVGHEWNTIAQLERQPGVVFAHPNWRVYAAELYLPAEDEVSGATAETAYQVNDPLYAVKQWYLQRVNAARAWALAEASLDNAASPIRVAVIDSGVDSNHPDLSPHIVNTTNYLVSEGEEDNFGHGTHVAGVIAATLNNGQGQSGLAPWVRIDARKVLDRDGSGTILNVAKAIEDATDDGARIINLSLETTSPSDTMRRAIEYAAGKGVLLVAAAGNSCASGGSTCPVLWPAAYAEVVAVAATNYSDQRAYYSAIGSEVEIAAPGGEPSFGPIERQIYSTWSSTTSALGECDNAALVGGGWYCPDIGTSMAASVVTGIAALVWSLDPDLDANDVRTLLQETATPLPYSATNVGSGRVDAHAALRRLVTSDLVATVPGLTYTLSPGSGAFSVTVTLENPSARAIAWQAELQQPADWIRLPSTPELPIAGQARYGEPAHVTLEVSPKQLATGGYGVTLMVVGRRADGSQVQRSVPITLLVDDTIYRVYFPLFVSTSDDDAMPVHTAAFRWETPDAAGRQIRTMTDQTNIGVSLPFTFPLRGANHTSLRLFSDGYAVFPADSSGPFQDNVCPLQVAWPGDALYGWWADLDPSKPGARVSLFETDDGQFVIEFLAVPTATGVEPGYSVSFQMVLHQDGRIDLNYLSVPDFIGRPPDVTIGVEAIDSRFRNRIFCAAQDNEFGLLPISRQTFVLTGEDIY